MTAQQPDSESEQARVSRELVESEQRYRFLAQSIPQMVWTAEPDGALNFVNEQVTRYFDARAEAVLGAGWLQWVHPDDKAHAVARWSAALRTGEPYETSFRLLCARDKSWRWHLVRAQPRTDDEGHVVQWLGTCTDIEAQKRAEAELQQQWRLFDTALSHTPDFTYTFDLEGRFTYVNAALLNLWQKTLPEARGKNFFELGYPEELAERLQRQIQQVIAAREPLRDHTPFTGPTGETRHYEYIFVPVLDASGNVGAVAGSTRDITERNRTEEALRASEERLRFALDAGGGVGAWDWDVRNDHFYADARFAELYGVDPERAAAGEPIASFIRSIHPGDRDRIQEKVREALESGQDYSEEYRVIQKDGSLRWVNARGRCRLDGQGAATRFLGVVFDITDRKQAEVALAEKAKLAALGADIGTALTQIPGLRQSLQHCAQSLVDHLDGAFARIWTMAPQEDVLELQASAGISADPDQAHARVAPDALKIGSLKIGSFKIGRIALERRPHLSNDAASDPLLGDPEWVKREGISSFAGYPLVVEDRPIGVLGLFARQPLDQDALTALASVSATIAIAIEHKRSEEELSKHAAELKRSNEDLEQFANVASHDLRSPLNTVTQFTELMLSRQGDSPDKEMSQFLQIVRNSARRMAELISALLAYSRLNSDDADARLPVSSAQAYQDAVANLHTAIEVAQAHIECTERLPEVLSNPTHLVQVFQNLISNAINYRGEAVPHIIVFAERRGAFWLFSVADNGPGIAPQYHSLIFEPFKRLHGQDRPGSGIGLAFCRKFIEREGGRIWVESREGQGATFRFTIPAVGASPAFD